jgi:hypothetical protein
MPLALLLAALAADSPQAAAPTQPEKPQLICRQGEQLVGSHIRTGRRCKTAVEWQEEDAKLDGPVPTLRVTGEQNDGHPLPQRPQ